MWPFKARAEPETLPSVDKRLADLELGLIEVRDSQEKTLAAIKRVQGRLMARIKVEDPGEAPEVAPSEPNGQPPAPPPYQDPKIALRARAAALRGTHR